MKMFWFFILISIFFKGCAAMPQKTNYEKKGSVLKYPVILVHGIAAHDRKSLVSFWGRIPQIYRDNGIEVFFGNTDS